METELNSCLVIFEMTGLQHFSLKSLTKENAKDKISKARTVGAVTMLLFLSTFMAFFVYSDNAAAVKTVTAKNVLMFVIQNSMNVGLILVVWTSLIQSYLTTRSVKKIFLNVKDFSQHCYYDFNICINFQQIKKSAWKKMSLITLFFSTVHGTSAYFQAKTLTDTVPMLFAAIPTFFLLVVTFKFVFYVDMVNSQLNYLNEILLNCNNVSKMVEKLHFNAIPVAPVKDSSSMRKLRAARKMYNIIYESAALINNSNGLSFLVLLMDSVVALMASGYEVFVIIIGDQSVDRIPQTIYVITFCVVILVVSVAYCHATSQIVSVNIFS